MNPDELYGEVCRLWSVDDSALLDLMSREWKGVSGREIQAKDAESCRLAMLSASMLKPPAPLTAIVWRARASSRFVALGWNAGLAALLMTEYFRALELTNSNYRRGRTVDVLVQSPEAGTVLDEMATLVQANDVRFGFGPDKEWVTRSVHEKRALLHLIAGSYAEADREYVTALSMTNERGRLKVDAGRAMIAFLSSINDGGDGEVGAQLTSRLAATEAAAKHPDLQPLLHENAGRMADGRSDLLIYEIL